MKRRSNRKSSKRRPNDVHRSQLEQLEIRSMLSADLWESLELIPASPSGAEGKQLATSYEGLGLDVEAMRGLLATAPNEFSGQSGIVIELPRPDGTFESFEVYSTNVMHPDLAARYTEIMTFTGQSLDNDFGSLRMDITPIGFHAQVLSVDGSYLVDPYYHLEDDFYTSYFRSDIIAPDLDQPGFDFNFGEETAHDDDIEDPDAHGLALANLAASSFNLEVNPVGRSTGGELRVFRTAIAANGEYTQFFGGTVTNGLAAVTTAINRISGIYESELGIRLELVATNDQIIYTDPATDPYADITQFDDLISNSVAENQTAIDAAIGTANYDIGHLFGYHPFGFGGYGPGDVGVDAEKAMGVSTLWELDTDFFYLLVGHEMGHQFGANHTWSSCNGFPSTEGTGAAVEPGSGITIMSYAGTCGVDDLAPDSVPYFSAISFDQILTYVDDTIPTIGTRISTGNQTPTVDAGADYVIPANTPFVLTANATDPEGNVLSYTWEQMDAGNTAPLAAGDNGTNAIFTFVEPTTSNQRYFPDYNDVLNNTLSIGEVYPATDRDLNFRVTVRDNNGTFSEINSDDMLVSVINTGTPFQFIEPAAGLTLTGGDLFNFTWDVAGTNAGQINVQNVRITMSIDGGLSYSETVVDSTSNDGAEELTVPNVPSDQVRFRIEAIGNIFYDITNANVTVVQGTGGGGGGGGVDVCGVALPDGTTSFAGAVGGNFFASNHAILDGTNPGQLGYDEVILDFLRGAGTSTEIAKSQYSIAVVGNGDAAWSFTNGTQAATGYERTDFYNINFIDPSVFNELIAHDLIIILSSDDAVTGGLSDNEMDLWATVEDNIANAVNDRGLDLWVGASGGDASYHDFLPTGVLTTMAETGLDPLDGFEVTVEGQLLGITDVMVDAADATFYYSAFDDDLASLEQRFIGESISVAAAGIAFFNDEMILAADVPGGTTQGMVGLAFEDLNMDGFHDPIEMGVGGAKFFIDYNGDGLIGLCEPTATSNAAGQFILRSAYSGTFRVLPVPSPGAVTTTTTPVYVTIQNDGSASLSAPLEFGVIAGSDGGNGGLGGSTPVAQGAYLGASPIQDDGVFFGNGIQKGTNTVTITSSVVHSNVVLNAWLDLNKDGDFNDPNERIFTNVKLTPGQHDYTFTIPQNVFDDSVLPDAARLAANIRFRVGPTLNIAPTANDAFGEIEDYKVFITQPAESGLVALDDVFTYVEDTDGQVFNVLANDSSFFNLSLTIVPGSVTNISPVETPPLDIYVSPDGTRIIFDADGVMDLTEDITFEYMVQDSAGVTETATVTLVAPIDPLASPATTSQLAFNNKNLAADVNNDGSLTNLDYVTILKELRTTGSRTLPNFGSGSTNFNMFIDVNGDGRFSALDLLQLSNALADSNRNGEPLEQEPLSSESVEALSAMPDVEVAAPISKNEVISPAAPVSRTFSTFPVVASDLVIASETGDSQAVEAQAVPDEVATELAFSSLGSDQSDLLWSDSDELEFASSVGEAEDDVFADPEWDRDLLSY